MNTNCCLAHACIIFNTFDVLCLLVRFQCFNNGTIIIIHNVLLVYNEALTCKTLCACSSITHYIELDVYVPILDQESETALPIKDEGTPTELLWHTATLVEAGHI